MNLEHLRALRAVAAEGSFEGAADVLGVSPSAVSQRMRALERTVGQVVVRRGAPCTPTDAGRALLRMARHVEALEEETWALLGRTPAGRSVTPLAVPADVLGTWFDPVLAAAAEWTDTALELHVEDQDHSAALLRRGEVLAAVTAEPQPVQGCTVEPLGAMRYVAVASPALLEQHRIGSGGVDLDVMPAVRFNSKDDLQGRVLRRHAPHARPPMHTAPSFDAFHRCVRAGLGWGVLVELQAAAELADGTLVRLPDVEDVLVPLHWQASTLPLARLPRLGRAVRDAAQAALEQPAAAPLTAPASSRGPAARGA